eukprot:104976_1
MADNKDNCGEFDPFTMTPPSSSSSHPNYNRDWSSRSDHSASPYDRGLMLQNMEKALQQPVSPLKQANTLQEPPNKKRKVSHFVGDTSESSDEFESHFVPDTSKVSEPLAVDHPSPRTCKPPTQMSEALDKGPMYRESSIEKKHVSNKYKYKPQKHMTIMSDALNKGAIEALNKDTMYGMPSIEKEPVSKTPRKPPKQMKDALDKVGMDRALSIVKEPKQMNDDDKKEESTNVGKAHKKQRKINEDHVENKQQPIPQKLFNHRFADYKDVKICFKGTRETKLSDKVISDIETVRNQLTYLHPKQLYYVFATLVGGKFATEELAKKVANKFCELNRK